jgi:hypothetical protein
MSSFINAWERQIYDSISKYGRDIVIRYNTVTQCSYCGIDPISFGSVKYDCATCDGTGYVKTATVYSTKAVMNTFLGNNRFVYYGNDKVNIISDGEARATIWLDGVLTNNHSTTGATILDSSYSIGVDGTNYTMKDYQRIGIDDLKVCIITLARIK